MTAVPPTSPAPDEMVGKLLAQRFRIEALLGSGGMAHVYRAKDEQSGELVAFKLLKDAIADNAEAAARLRREAELLSRFEHPAIVGIEHVGRLPDGRIYLAMEYLLGETLGGRMRARKRLSQAELTPILAGAVAGLHVAHEGGVVHRDLKPDNIFLEALPEGGMQVKLLDFGISKHVGHERLTRTGQVLGTPRYMAPEQLAADKNLDGRVDTYALGVILYEALSGNPPFLGATPSELVQAILHGRVTPIRSYVPDLSPGLEVVVHRAMARAKDARYESARALFEAWLEALGEEPSKGMAGVDHTNVLGPMGGLPDGGSGSSRSEPPASFSDFAPGGARKPAVAAAAVPNIPEERISAPETAQASPRARRPRDETPTGSASSQRHRSVSASSMPVPVKKSRKQLVALLAAALLAGICTAGMFVVGWQKMHTPASAAPAPTSTEPNSVVAPESEGAPATPRANPDAPDSAAPTAPTPPSTTPPGAAPSDAPSRVTPTEPAAANAAPGTPEALYADALAAQQRGDMLGCTQLAAAALRAGGSPLYHRTEGECYAAMGDRLNSLKAFERFCAAAPRTDPNRGRIQVIVRAANGRCD